MRWSFGLIACLATLAGPALAEELSDDALLKLFKAQRDAFRAAQSSGLGKTRGLTLVTVDSSTTAAAAGTMTTLLPEGQAADTAAGTTGATAGETAATGTTVAAATTKDPVVFGALAPELQVNVNIKFDFDSAALNDGQKPLLAQLCTVMKGSDIGLFRIIGHTDASGGDAYNQKLSLLRAEEVRRYLVSDCGIAATRLEAMGVGEKFLADEGDPKAAANRRVEFQALS